MLPNLRREHLLDHNYTADAIEKLLGVQAGPLPGEVLQTLQIGVGNLITRSPGMHCLGLSHVGAIFSLFELYLNSKRAFDPMLLD